MATEDNTKTADVNQAEAATEDQAAAADSDAATAADTADAPADPVAALTAALETAESERDAAKDQALRAVAEGQNAQRRAEKDVENARKFALERFAGDLLPVVDNMERALETSGDVSEEGAKAVLEGIELTRKSFVDALQKHGLQAVDPQGEPFDPQLHQAMSAVENPDVEPNTVIAVMQKGYTLNGRLLRPAMVMVSKAPAAS